MLDRTVLDRLNTGKGPIRVCHASLTLRTGGLERLLVEFARHHDRNRFELTFLALEKEGRPADDIRAAGCQVVSLDCAHQPKVRQIRRLSHYFRQHQFDVLHTHNPFPHLYATPAARFARVPVIVHTRHGRHSSQNRKQQLLYGMANVLTDWIVGVSDDAAALCNEVGLNDAKKITRIWNGIDEERFEYKGPADAPVGISVGRLSAEKDFPTLIRAVHQVAGSEPRFRMMIVGDGPERPTLTELTETLNLQNHVQLLGERSDVAQLLSQAAFYVSSSVTEGISLTLLEAMAVGLPVIATRVGGTPEVVVPNQTGLLIPPSDPGALSETILELCNDPDRRLAMGKQGRRRLTRHFSAAKMVRQYELLYTDFLRGKRRLPEHRTGRAMHELQNNSTPA